MRTVLRYDLFYLITDGKTSRQNESGLCTLIAKYLFNLIRRAHMQVNLLKADIGDAKEIHAMQIIAFKELLEKYQDFDTNPASESVQKVETRLMQDFTYYYFICVGSRKAGVVRVVDRKEIGRNKRISPIFILPEFQGRGVAQRAIRLCEELHGEKIGSLILFCRSRKTAIYMRKWVTGGRAAQELSTKGLRWCFMKSENVNSREVYTKGIDHSYYYEVYAIFKTEEL